MTAQALSLWALSRPGETSDLRRLGLLSGMAATVCLAIMFVTTQFLARRVAPEPADRGHDWLCQALKMGRSVGWDWEVESGKDTWFGDLNTMFGMSGDTYVGQVAAFRSRVHPDDRQLVWRAVVDARDNRTGYHANFRLVLPDGTIRWATANGRFEYSPLGQPVRMLGIATDVTDCKHGEDQLRESEERWRLLAHTAPVLLRMSGPDRSSHYFNRSWLEFTGRPLQAELGEGWTEGVHPDDRARCVETYTAAFDRREPSTMEYRLRRHDQEYRWVLDTSVPRFTPDGSFVGCISSAIDVTTFKVAEVGLTGLSHRLITNHELERISVARELHDNLGQRLALLTIDMERWSQSLPQGSADVRIEELCARAIDLGHDLQVISNRLHSPKIEFLGVASEAASVCRELSERERVTIDFQHRDVPPDLPGDIALCLIRVLQEALHNAVQHAGVRQFAVALTGGREQIQLEVIDQGIGFDPGGVGDRGLGLISMRERLRLVRGHLSIASRPAAGTRVLARIPWSAGGVA